MHIDQFVSYHLMPYKRNTKSLALARPFQCFVKTCLRKTQGTYGHGQAFTVEVSHDHLETGALVPHQKPGRHANMIKAQVGSV